MRLRLLLTMQSSGVPNRGRGEVWISAQNVVVGILRKEKVSGMGCGQ